MTNPIPALQEQNQPPFESVYNALRTQARQYLRREQNATSMSPTVLVHEAWMALARSPRQVADRDHYLRLVNHVMKNLLIDHARRHKAVLHGGAMQRIEWTEDAAASRGNNEMVLAVAAAMDDLTVRAPRHAKLVELRYFSGFTERETAQILGISIRTVRRQWHIARLRLLESLQGSQDPEGHGHE